VNSDFEEGIEQTKVATEASMSAFAYQQKTLR
jgi:hypothetical protein